MARRSTYSTITPILTDYLSATGDPGGTPASKNVTITALRDLLQANLVEISNSTDIISMKRGLNAQGFNVDNTDDLAGNREWGGFWVDCKRT